MQQLLTFQSLWAMQGLPSVHGSGSLKDSIRAIAEAKFDGISAVWIGRESCRSVSQCARDNGLRIEAICFPKSVDDLERSLDLVAEYPVWHLDIHADIRPRTLEACAPVVEGWLRLIEQVDYPVYFETHRDRLTNDLFFTLELLRRYPQIKVLADLSHYVVGRALVYPVTAESDAAIHEILGRSWAYHGRVASSDQVQVELSLPQYQNWVGQFASWWRDGFEDWRRRAPDDGALVFTCELGPQPVAIAGRDGKDRSDRWLEALQMRDLARDIWRQTNKPESQVIGS